MKYVVPKYVVPKYVVPILIALFISACGGSGDDPVDSTDSTGGTDTSADTDNNTDADGGDNSLNGGASSSDGRVSFSLTDAPVDDATAVNLTVTELRIIDPADSDGDTPISSFPLESPLAVDLLALQGSQSAPLLTDVDIPVGTYSELRLLLSDNPSDNSISFDDGSQVNLKTPSASSSGLKLKGDFTITAAGGDFTIDFDLRQSIVAQGNGGFLLKPVIRIVDNTVIGTISGNVDPAACGSDVSNIEDVAAVYLYPQHDTTPIDYNAEEAPLSSSLLTAQTGTETGITYEFGFINAGEYTITLACDASVNDDVEQQDSLTYAGTSNIVVTSAENTELNFAAAPEPEDPVVPIITASATPPTEDLVGYVSALTCRVDGVTAAPETNQYVQWTVVSEPTIGDVTFADALAAETTVNLLSTGSYVLQCSVFGNSDLLTDPLGSNDVSITVEDNLP